MESVSKWILQFERGCSILRDFPQSILAKGEGNKALMTPSPPDPSNGLPEVQFYSLQIGFHNLGIIGVIKPSCITWDEESCFPLISALLKIKICK